MDLMDSLLWLDELRLEYAATKDARTLIRDRQKTVHSADAWHTLANSLNMLDARADALESVLEAVRDAIDSIREGF